MKATAKYGILKCEVHCIDEATMQLEELGITSTPEYQWKTFYVNLDSIVAIGEFEEQDGTIEVSLHLSNGDSFVVKSAIDHLVEIWSEHKRI